VVKIKVFGQKRVDCYCISGKVQWMTKKGHKKFFSSPPHTQCQVSSYAWNPSTWIVKMPFEKTLLGLWS